MKTIGSDAPLTEHSREVLYTAARCRAHPDAGIQQIGERMLEQRKSLEALFQEERALHDGEILALALVISRDHARDRSLISMGSFLQAIDPQHKHNIFPNAPSSIARLPHDKETDAVQHVLARLQQLPPDHAVRTTYETRLTEENHAFQNARNQQTEHELQMSRFRIRLLNAKIDNDHFRFVCFGEAAQILPKAECDALFQSIPSSKSSKPKQQTNEPNPSPSPATNPSQPQ